MGLTGVLQDLQVNYGGCSQRGKGKSCRVMLTVSSGTQYHEFKTDMCYNSLSLSKRMDTLYFRKGGKLFLDL